MGSHRPWFVVPVFAILLDRLFIKTEEDMLEVSFGDAYRDYKQRVRR